MWNVIDSHGMTFMGIGVTVVRMVNVTLDRWRCQNNYSNARTTRAILAMAIAPSLLT